MSYFSFLATSIFLNIYYGCDVSAAYLPGETNYHKVSMERNNKVNMGVWRRAAETKVYNGNFLFPVASQDESLGEIRERMYDVDNRMNSDVDDSPNLFSRLKRSISSEFVATGKTYPAPCTGNDANCIETTPEVIQTIPGKSEFISNIKPASVFNDYPYEIAVLLNDDINDIVQQTNNNDVDVKVVPLADGKDYVDIYVTPTDKLIDINEIYATLKEAANHTINTIDASIKPTDYEGEIIKNKIFKGNANATDDTGKQNRNIIMGIFNKEHQPWPIKPPKVEVTNNNIVIPKARNTIKSKTINGEGLIKVLSMLTKIFKKVMKQHEDIKKIHDSFHMASNDFAKTVEGMTQKLEDFQDKYNAMVELGKRISMMEAKIEEKHGQIQRDQNELSESLAKFLDCQKKFMMQQTQFYETQKAILAQNQNISQKQSFIARSQNAVSIKQSEFARIIQKVKKLYNSRKNSKLSPNLQGKFQQKTDEITTSIKPLKITVQPTATETTESVKIDLFSIPIKEKLKNQDQNLLREKDEQSIDDIVYKFYFNNTFIDNLLKTGVLASYVHEPISTTTKDHKKRSRDRKEKHLKTTVLLPITDVPETIKRERRWIGRNKSKQPKPVANRFVLYDDNEPANKNKKNHKLAHDKNIIEDATEKNILEKGVSTVSLQNNPKVLMDTSHLGVRTDPYRIMATNFCNQIKQNFNRQILDWCIEKALRKLKGIENSNRFVRSKLEYSAITWDPQEAKYTLMIERLQKKLQDVKVSLLPLERNHTVGGDNVNTSAKTIHTFRKVASELLSTPTSVTSPTRSATEPILTTTADITTTTYLTSTTERLSTLAPAIFFPDNDELESNLKQFDLTPDPEGNVYFDGSIHSSKLVTDKDDDGLSDLLPGMDSNSNIDIDPHALELQALRRASVRKSNADILKNADHELLNTNP